MTQGRWKKVRARSLRHAMELCLEHARDQRKSVDHVADLVGLSSKWTLYKWLENGRMPAILIRPFEYACGATFVTEYIALSAHRIPVPIPVGRAGGASQINELQASFSDAVGALIRFYDGKSTSDEALTGLQHALQALAWHRENVIKMDSPELGLFVDEDPSDD